MISLLLSRSIRLRNTCSKTKSTDSLKTKQFRQRNIVGSCRLMSTYRGSLMIGCGRVAEGTLWTGVVRTHRQVRWEGKERTLHFNLLSIIWIMFNNHQQLQSSSLVCGLCVLERCRRAQILMWMCGRFSGMLPLQNIRRLLFSMALLT